MSSGVTMLTSFDDFANFLPVSREDAPYAVPLDPWTTDVRPFISFNPDGSVRASGVQAVGYTWKTIAEGGLYVVGDADIDRSTGEARNWVDWVDGAWAVVPRPILTQTFDTLTLAPGQEATLPNLPAATVEFSGPVSGKQLHSEPGDLTIGWRVPGTYKVRVDAFPYMPLTFTFKVAKP